MKKLIISLLLVVIVSASVNAESYFDLNIYLDGKMVYFNEEYGFPFIDKASRTQMPFRKLLEDFGAEVYWEDETRSAVAIKGDITVRVPIGKNYILKNGEKIMMDTVSVIIDDRTFIPLRSIMEAFGTTVTWSEASKRIDIKTNKKPKLISKLPIRYDLRNIGRITPVRDQGYIGACWAFASIAAIESVISENTIVDLSEDNLSLNHGYNLTQNEGGDVGISLAYLTRWSGPVYEKDDVYGDSAAADNVNAAYHVQEAKILPYKDYNAIKRAIMQYGGVQSSIRIVDVGKRDLGDSYNDATSSFYYSGSEGTNHDVLIIGWDDSFSKENFNKKPKRDGAFICKNSYGLGFGDNGYFYVSYEDTHIGGDTLVFSRIDGPNNYDKIYQTDLLGKIGKIGYVSPSAYFANVYRAEKKEVLKAVSFYTVDRDSNYEIFIVPKYKTKSDFSKKVFLKKGRINYAGYYTVDLNVGVEVSGDFAVIVHINTPDTDYPVAIEYENDAPWLKDVDISDGRGYMSADGETWDRTEVVSQCNVCLKAFTDYQ